MNFINETIAYKHETYDRDERFSIAKPKLCLHCYKESNQSIQIHTKKRSKSMVIVTKCPICDKYNLYAYSFKTENSSKGDYVPYTYLPQIENNINEDLEKLSPIGCKTYQEALVTLALSLNEVTGMAIRKAIECFIKDYLITFIGKDKNKIIKMPLAAAIREIEDAPKLVSLSDAIRELGNDNTHYNKKYDEISVSHMKEFADYLIEHIKVEIKLKKTTEIIENSKN